LIKCSVETEHTLAGIMHVESY